MKKHLRKIQFTGKSTYIVSLPKKWVLDHGLKPGSQVVIEESNAVITIKPATTSQYEAKRIVLSVDANQDPEAVVRWVIGAYVMGYDEIVIRSSVIQPQLRNAIRNAVLNRLPAAEIANEDINEIQVHIILAPNKQPLSNALRRLAKVVLSVLSDSCTVINRKDPEMADEVLREDDSIDRVYFYVYRLINMSALGRAEIGEDTSSVELLMYRSFSKLLERIGDHAVNVARQVKELVSTQIPSDVYKLCLEIVDICRKSTEAFFEKNPFYIQEVAELVNNIKRFEKTLVETHSQHLKSPELLSFKLMLESLRRIAEYSKDIAELALDMGLDKVSAIDKSK